MKRVIKNKKKMKNTMYIVFGVFALALFGVTMWNPSYANEGLIIDDALDKIAEQTVILDPLPEEDESETSDESLDGDVTEPELTPDEKALEGDENSQDLELDEDDNNDNEYEENLDGKEVDNGENDKNEDGDKEGKTEESDKTSETDEGDTQLEVETPEVPLNEENHVVSSESEGNYEEDIIMNRIMENDMLSMYKNSSMQVASANSNDYVVHDEEKGVITVYAKDFSYGITLQDKNLGASTLNSAGNYYQWGDNHGDSRGQSSELLQWNSSYDNHGYDGPNNKFITIGYVRCEWDDEEERDSCRNEYYGANRNNIWSDNSTHDNLWGGGNDNVGTNYGYDLENHVATNIEGRRGPCGEGYHVPSAGEFMELMKLYAQAKGYTSVLTSNNYSLLSIPNTNIYDGGTYNFVKNFISDFYVNAPIYAYMESWGSSNYFLSSTPLYGLRIYAKEYKSSSRTSYDKYFSVSGVSRISGFRVRCAKDIYESPTFNTLRFMSGSIEVASGKVISGSVRNGNLSNVTRDGYNVGYWHLEGEDTEFNLATTPITGDITLYAHWTPIEYTITYNLYGGTNNASNTGKYTIETPAITLQNATKEGYIFSGWFTSTNFTSANKITEIPTGTTGNKTLYALFQKTVTINFNVNGSNGDNQQIPCTMNNNENTCSITSPSISAPEGWTAQRWSSESNKDTHTNDWSAGASKNVSTSGTYYAQFKKSEQNLTANFNTNGATSLTYTSTGCTIPEVWNGASQSDTCTVKAPNITREGWLIIGFNTNQNGNNSTLNTGADLELSSSNNGVTYYAITKEILTGTFYLNGNTSQTPNGKSVSTAESVAETCNLWNTGTQCDIITPTYVPANGKIAKGYTTDADVSNQSNPTFVSTGTSISLTSSAQYYAQSKSDDTILHVTYLSGVGVQSIGKNSDSCTLTGTWNSISQATECTVKAPTIILKVGYKAGIWTTGSIAKNPGDDITLTKDDTYTARAINNTDTQYHINYYKENLDGTYDLFETWTGYGTTDTQAIATGTDKSYVGFAFSGTHANNVASGNIDGDGSRVLSLYYDRVAYKLNYVVDGNIIQSGNVKYGVDITVPVDPKKECNEFSGWTSSVDGLTTTGTMSDSDVTFTANWNYTCSRSSGGGGAKKVEKATREIAIEPVAENEHNSADEKENAEAPEVDEAVSNDENSNQVISVTQEVLEDGTVEAVVETVKIKNTDIIATVRTEVNPSNSSSSTTHTKEQNDAYSFAKSNGITSMSSIEKAKMNTRLKRIEMAKMLSNYAINVLGIEPDLSKGTVEFKDVTEEMDKKYDNAVTKVYQLGIMGQNTNGNMFRPNDEVTRAEFAAVLSRLLYHTSDGKYKGTREYYRPHIEKLYNEGIVKTVIPGLKELRGYVMTMLMRTVK